MSYKRNPNRKSYRGNLKNTKGALAKAAPKKTPTGHSHYPNYGSTWSGTGYTAPPKLPAVSDEVTNYGATKFRNPHTKGEYVGLRGSKIPAGVLDIDGTLQTYGQGADKDLLKWVEKVQKANPDMVWLVVTARDHGSFGYDTSFNWVMRHFPYPFAAMVARPKDDPRYASEFKREVAQGWEDMGLYQIIAAADDNSWVIKMWKQWAIEHFEEPKDFELFEASYGSYADWRYGLDSKVGGPKTYSSTTTYVDPHKDEVWIRATEDADGKWSKAHWAKRDSAEAKAQAASDHAKYGQGGMATGYAKDPVDGVWKSRKDHGVQPEPGDPIADDQAWAVYFTRREDAGAYLDIEREAIIESEWDTSEDEELDYFVDRETMEMWVAHENKDLSPDDLANMSNKELWQAVEMDYDDELHLAIDRKFPDVFGTADLRLLETSELEELFKINDEAEAVGYLEDVLGADFATEPEEEDEDILSPERRDLEQEVYANTELDEGVIASMDTEVLKQLLAHNTMLNNLDEDAIEMPPTGELDVAEILRQLGEDEVLDEAEQIIAAYDYHGDDEAQAGVA